MDPGTDPIGMIVSGGGGLGGGAIGGYLLSRVLSNGKGNDNADIKNEQPSPIRGHSRQQIRRDRWQTV